jgi:hypothetical protein
MEFDVETAIETRIAETPKSEKERWQRYQEEQRAKLQIGDGRSLLASRQIELALSELANGSEDEFEYTRMAEGYSLLGDFEIAAQMTRDPEKKAFYQKVLAAPDMECEHGKMILFDKYPGLTLFICPVCKHLRKTAT